MRLPHRHLYFCCVIFLLIAPITLLPIEGHDWQRFAELLIALLAIGFLLAKHQLNPLLRKPYRFAATLVVLGGIVSSTLASQPRWAFAELALLLACCGISMALARERLVRGASFDRAILIVVVALCSMKSVEYLAIAAAAFTSGMPTLDTDLLLDGFSNKRFYGQFQTMTLPLLALPLLLTRVKPSIKAGVFILLAVWWLIAVSGGTRGTWLGMGAAGAVIAFCGAQGRRWLKWQGLAAMTGIISFWLLFSVMTDYLGIEVVNFAGDRLNTSLSAREIIWNQAVEMIKARPLLGFGPMHFADIHNPVAAHPHQAILQWASEWGIPSTLLVIWLVSSGLLATLRLIRKKSLSVESVDMLRICLFASVVGALAQAMVDGVIVMPYTQLWLAIVVGWLLGIHEGAVKPLSVSRYLPIVTKMSLLASLFFLGFVVVRDMPRLDEQQQAFSQIYGNHFQPRFWEQGVIAPPEVGLLEPVNAANFSAQTPK